MEFNVSKEIMEFNKKADLPVWALIYMQYKNIPLTETNASVLHDLCYIFGNDINNMYLILVKGTQKGKHPAPLPAWEKQPLKDIKKKLLVTNLDNKQLQAKAKILKISTESLAFQLAKKRQLELYNEFTNCGVFKKSAEIYKKVSELNPVLGAKKQKLNLFINEHEQEIFACLLFDMVLDYKMQGGKLVKRNYAYDVGDLLKFDKEMFDYMFMHISLDENGIANQNFEQLYNNAKANYKGDLFNNANTKSQLLNEAGQEVWEYYQKRNKSRCIKNDTQNTKLDTAKEFN